MRLNLTERVDLVVVVESHNDIPLIFFLMQAVLPHRMKSQSEGLSDILRVIS